MNSKNAEMPAYPVSAKVERDFINGGWGSPGLTKRELIAAMVFQQFLHGAVLPEGFDATSQLRAVAARAIESADALLAELERRDD